MASESAARLLLLFDSRGGLTEQLAEAIAEGVRAVPGAELRYRRIDDADPKELLEIDALILWSRTRDDRAGCVPPWPLFPAR